MTQRIMTIAQAQVLYERGLAFCSGPWQLITRTACYELIPTTPTQDMHYEATHTGLRHVHSIGARWNGTRYIPCHCDHCQRYPDLAAQVDIAGFPLSE